MATLLRHWSYRYQWLYDTVSSLAALAVGGNRRFRQLPLQGLAIGANTQALDLCCGAGPATQQLLHYSRRVTGLDASPVALQRAARRAPGADYIVGQAEAPPLASNRFDLVHTSVAMHEMAAAQRRQIYRAVYRILKPGGTFVMLDFHSPTNPLYWPGLALFLGLFETETAWQLLQADAIAELQPLGFEQCERTLHAGGSLQVVRARKPG